MARVAMKTTGCRQCGKRKVVGKPCPCEGVVFIPPFLQPEIRCRSCRCEIRTAGFVEMYPIPRPCHCGALT